MVRNTTRTSLNTTPTVSIIIPHFNGVDILTDCLTSLNKSNYKEKEIIVVDNGSSDDSCSILSSNFPSVKLIKSSKNLGYAGGCNLGAKNAKSPLIIFLNNDTTQTEAWIEYLVKRINSDPNIASVQPKILDANIKDHFEYAGGAGGFMDKYGFPFTRGRIFDKIEIDEGQYDDACPIFWASGTAFITRKKIFLKLGGFDEKLFSHFEEIDYHWKCHLIGYRVWVEPKSTIYHIGGRTLNYGTPFKTYLNHRNSFITVISNTLFKELFFVLFVRILFQLASILRELFKVRLNHAWAQIKAILWILINLKYVIERRAKIQSLKTESVLNSIYSGSIVIDFFLKGEHKFSKIANLFNSN